MKKLSTQLDHQPFHRADHHGSRGSSMVEVLVAILIFSLGALGVLTMTTSSLRVNSHSEAVDDGTNLARLKMEELLAMPYNAASLDDANNDGEAGLMNDDNASADFTDISGHYNIYWNVARNLPVNRAKTVSVIVSWTGTQGAKRVVFQTIKAESP